MVDAIELTNRRNPESSAPQSTDQPGADGLNAALCRKARDRAQGNGLHRLAEIAAGDNNVAGVVTGRLGGRWERRVRRRPGLSLGGTVWHGVLAPGDAP